MQDHHFDDLVRFLRGRGVNPIQNRQINAGRDLLEAVIGGIPRRFPVGECQRLDQLTGHTIHFYCTLTISRYASKRSVELDRFAGMRHIGHGGELNGRLIAIGVNVSVTGQDNDITVPVVLFQYEMVEAVRDRCPRCVQPIPIPDELAVQINLDVPSRPRRVGRVA